VHQVATAITTAALSRTESRGGHFRTDFPLPDEAWRLRQVLTIDPDGVLTTSRAALPDAP